jgi:hypothetical protein
MPSPFVRFFYLPGKPKYRRRFEAAYRYQTSYSIVSEFFVLASTLLSGFRSQHMFGFSAASHP